MAEYRRDKSKRVFFKVTNGKVVKVSNKYSYVAIQNYHNPMFAEEVVLDYETAMESEFLEAFKEARDRILMDGL